MKNCTGQTDTDISPCSSTSINRDNPFLPKYIFLGYEKRGKNLENIVDKAAIPENKRKKVVLVSKCSF